MCRYGKKIASRNATTSLDEVGVCLDINLFGFPEAPSDEMRCSVYHDERFIENKWLYHAFLFVPNVREMPFLSDLHNIRKITGWDRELHFGRLNNTHTQNNCAKACLKSYLDKHSDQCRFYFIGVDQSALAKELWDPQVRNFKIYNRFFQIGLYSAIKWLFINPKAGFRKVCIEKVFSDSKNRSSDDRFHTQPIEDIEFSAAIKKEAISFESKTIIEVDSDHRKETDFPQASHIVQLVDLLAGSMSQMFDNTSKHEGKHLMARCLWEYDLPKAIMGYDKDNFKSKFYKRIGLSFFPKTKLGFNEILNPSIFHKKNAFFIKRTLSFAELQQHKFQSVELF